MARTLWDSLGDYAAGIGRRAFEGIHSLEDWRRARPGIDRDFLRGFGLDPMPAAPGPGPARHGEFAGPGFRAGRLSIEILPACPVTANLYFPDPLPAGRLPAVLYLCGHVPVGTWYFQYHAIMWARRGYACLVLDTIEQNDNPGEHHGALAGLFDRWVSLGWTGAGGELLSSIRALDTLCADPRVDPERVGVTGVSGGGALAFFLAAADRRVRAVSVLCGISTQLDAVVNRHLDGHCDCMYYFNARARDTAEYGALIAPRPALFCFAEHDDLFHPREIRTLVGRVRRVYRLYGQAGNCRLLMIPGGHGDHPEFDEATADWFDRHLAGRKMGAAGRRAREIPETETSVFNGAGPADNRLDLLPELVSPRGSFSLPACAADWPAIRRRALDRLRPVTGAGPAARRPVVLRPDGEWCRGDSKEFGVGTNRAHRGMVDGMEIRLRTETPPGDSGPAVLTLAGPGETARHALRRLACAGGRDRLALAALEPRLSTGNGVFSGSGSVPVLHRRAMAQVGLTAVTMTMRDIAGALDYLCSLPEMKGRALYLCGRDFLGVAALYQALYDRRVTGVILEDPPASHLDGAPLFGVLRVLDLPQAVGLMAPRPVFLVRAGIGNWNWPVRLGERIGAPGWLSFVDSAWQAMEGLAA